jgi:hypothetical protein
MMINQRNFLLRNLFTIFLGFDLFSFIDFVEIVAGN